MTWEVEFDDAFDIEFAAFAEDVKDALLAVAKLLADYGPHLGRPHADTLKGSKHANMKELRFEASDGEWRAAFAFDPRRKAIVLVAGDKSGAGQKRFYKRLIATADRCFSAHLERLKAATKKGK
ncbi:MAG: type II toxin-antitoxin system RelE/ParE family toxin [Pseudomonadota bacterium]|nr:type II toxin-antitoxin system RelE/ParE family toxin [Pseudomonadota bacterium]